MDFTRMTDADLGQLAEVQEWNNRHGASQLPATDPQWYAAAGRDTEYTDPTPDRYDDDDDGCRCQEFMAGGKLITDITDCPVHDCDDPHHLDQVWSALERR